MMPKRKIPHLQVVKANKEQKPRPRNPYSDAFEEAFEKFYDGEPYNRKGADFVHLAGLIKLHGGKLDADRWQKAVANYFLTPMGMHTLADLCNRFATFAKYPLDKYKNPAPAKSGRDRLEDTLEQFK